MSAAPEEAALIAFKPRTEVRRLTVEVLAERNGVKKPPQVFCPGSWDTVTVNYVTGIAYCGPTPPEYAGFAFFVPQGDGKRHLVCAKRMDGFVFERLRYRENEIPRASIERHAKSRKGYGETPDTILAGATTWFFPLTSRHAGSIVMDFTDEQEDGRRIHYRVRVRFYFIHDVPAPVPAATQPSHAVGRVIPLRKKE